jgi:hypothetical protein
MPDDQAGTREHRCGAAVLLRDTLSSFTGYEIRGSQNHRGMSFRAAYVVCACEESAFLSNAHTNSKAWPRLELNNLFVFERIFQEQIGAWDGSLTGRLSKAELCRRLKGPPTGRLKVERSNLGCRAGSTWNLGVSASKHFRYTKPSSSK